MGARHLHESEALLIQRVAYAEFDWVATLFARGLGKISVIALGARKSKKRYLGGLEPFHNLMVQLRSGAAGELQYLHGSEIILSRQALVENLNAMQAAARGMAWLRHALPAGLVDPDAWELTQDWLDALDTSARSDVPRCEQHTATYGLRLLRTLGWALQLENCIRCGKSCPANASAYFAPRVGGIVCRSCGGAESILSCRLRSGMIAAAAGARDMPALEDAADVLDLIEATLRIHAGMRP